MSTNAALDAKIIELCAAITEDETVKVARQSAESFLTNEEAMGLYREVMNLGRSLETRHRQGEKISDEDIETFEDLQATADSNPLIQGFNEAQNVLQGIAGRVSAFVTKTLEKGSVPSADEIGSGGGGCGEGCGCHH